MKEKLYKNKNRILSIVTSFVVVLSLFLVPLEVDAVVGTGTGGKSFLVPYSRPSTDYGQGYITLIFTENSTGKNYTYTFFWSISQFLDEDNDVSLGDCHMYLKIESNKITFVPQIVGLDYGVWTLSQYGFNDQLSIRASNSFQGNYSCPVSYPSGCTLIGYEFGGNVSLMSAYIASAPIDIQWNVGYVYSEYVYLLNQMLSKMPSNTYLTDLYNQIVKISNHEENIDNRTRLINELLSVELPKIWDEINGVNAELDNIYAEMLKLWLEVNASNKKLDNIYAELETLHNDLLQSSDTNKTDAFQQSSDAQSSELNGLNQQMQPDKIDINSASSNVDANLDLNVDANYGVLLSTFTNNGTILKMMLAVASMGLISYVLFGKR